MRLEISYTAMSHDRPVNVQWNHLRLQFVMHWAFMLVQCMVAVVKLFLFILLVPNAKHMINLVRPN